MEEEQVVLLLGFSDHTPIFQVCHGTQERVPVSTSVSILVPQSHNSIIYCFANRGKFLNKGTAPILPAQTRCSGRAYLYV